MKKCIEKNTPDSVSYIEGILQKGFEQKGVCLKKQSSKKKTLKPLLIFFPLLLILCMGLFTINKSIDRQCRTTLTALLEEQLNRKITIGESSFGFTKIHFNDITLFETMKGEKVLMSVNNVDIFPDFIEYLFTKRASFRKVVVTEPILYVVLNKSGSFNIPELNGEVLVTIHDVIRFLSNSQELTIDEMDIKKGMVTFRNNDPKTPLSNLLISNLNGELSDFLSLRKYHAKLGFLLNYKGKKTNFFIQGGKKTTVSKSIFSLKAEGFDVALLKDFLQGNYPLRDGSLDVDVALRIHDDEKNIEVNGKVGVMNARLNSESLRGKSLLPRAFTIDQGFTFNTKTYAMKIHKAFVRVPKAGDIFVKGKVFPKNVAGNSFDLNVEAKDFDLAAYLRGAGHKIPARKQTLVSSTFSLQDDSAKNRINASGTAHFKSNRGFDMSAAITAAYFCKKRYGDITLEDIVIEDNKAKLPMLLVKEARFKRVKVSAKKTSMQSLFLLSPELNLVQESGKTINISKAFKSVFLIDEPKVKAKGKGYSLYVRNLTVKDGNSSYTDKSSTKTLSHFNLSNVNMTVSNLGNHTKQLAKLKVDAKVLNPSRKAYLFVDGKVNPFTFESKGLKLRVKRLPLKDYSYITRKMNNFTVQEGDLDVFVEVNVDKETNFISTVDLELYKLKVKFPQKDAKGNAMLLETLKRDGDVIKLKDIKLTGNIKQEDYDFSEINSAILRQSLTSNSVLATGAGVLGGTALFSNVLLTVIAAASPVVLPVTAAVLGGTAIYHLVNGEETEVALKK